MKKLYIFALATALGLSANAAVPFQKGKAPVRAKSSVTVSAPVLRAPQTQVLIEEDFSRFTDGSIESPAGDITSNGKYQVPAEFTAQPGWTARGLHPAGGCVVLKKWQLDEEESRGGYLSTPPALLNGTATLTFRAKKHGTEPASLWIAVCDDYYGPGDDQEDYILTDDWQTFTFVATHASLEDMSYIQISAEKGSVVLDDVKLTLCPDRIATPSANAVINLSPTAFKASWDEVQGAEGYLLTVRCTEAPKEVETGEITEDFEGLNLSADGKKIDTANPGIHKDWKVDVSSKGSKDASTDPSEVASGSKALFFDAEGDYIETADAPLPLDGLSFWVRAIGPDEQDYYNMSLIQVELYQSATDNWNHVANLYYADFLEEGSVYTLDPMTFTDDVTRVRLTFIQKGSKVFAIDDIKLHYRTRGTVSNILDNFPVNATEYEVNNIKPENDYVYSVKAYAGDVVSEASYPMWVDGITGLKVECHEPSNVSKTSFTASWEPLGHASDYTVSLSRIISPTQDLEDVVVFDDNFDNVTEGTVDNPMTDWMSPKDFGAAGFTKVSWSATQPAWANGMIGTSGTNWYGAAGLVFTPALDLSCYDGNGITIDATFVTTVSNFETGNGTENEGIFAMLMNNYTDTQALAHGLLETPAAGSNSGTFKIENVQPGTDLSNVIIAFMNKSGRMFFVDQVKITINVAAGKTLVAPYDVVSVQETSHDFTSLDAAYDYGYQVVASASRNFYSYTSDPSEMKIAKVSTGVAGIQVENAQARYFNLQGMPVEADAMVPGIYIEQRGNTTRKVLKR